MAWVKKGIPFSLKKETLLISSSPDETKTLGKLFMQKLLESNKKVVAFYGDLGVGKTLFIKGMASFLQIPEQEVVSPTFTYLNIYPSLPAIYHFDLYRIDNEAVFKEMGFLEYLEEQLCLIEWAEKIPTLVPEDAVKVTLSHKEENKREILIH